MFKVGDVVVPTKTNLIISPGEYVVTKVTKRGRYIDLSGSGTGLHSSGFKRAKGNK